MDMYQNLFTHLDPHSSSSTGYNPLCYTSLVSAHAQLSAVCQVGLSCENLIHVNLNYQTVFPLNALHLLPSLYQLPTCRKLILLITRAKHLRVCSHPLHYGYLAILHKASEHYNLHSLVFQNQCSYGY